MRNLDIQTAFEGLDDTSLVLDIGAYHGEWSYMMARYGCAIEAYEPVPDYYNELVSNCGSFPNVKCHQMGVSSQSGSRLIWPNGDATSMHIGRGEPVSVNVIDIAEIVPPRGVDLLKLNVEGEEYAIVRRIIDAGVATRIRHMLIQWHGFGFAAPEENYEALDKPLETTHRTVSRGSWEYRVRL